MIFKTKKELLTQAEKDGACEAGLQWARGEKSLTDILGNIPLRYRLWCIRSAYEQFAEFCDWGLLDGDDWARLLTVQPQLAEYCYWGMLNSDDWRCLLIKQPQFAEFCDWSKLTGWGWVYLLEKQPQFADLCDWGKLNNYDWLYLLTWRPELEKYREVNND
jgi:hypothetical protein